MNVCLRAMCSVSWILLLLLFHHHLLFITILLQQITLYVRVSCFFKYFFAPFGPVLLLIFQQSGDFPEKSIDMLIGTDGVIHWFGENYLLLFLNMDLGRDGLEVAHLAQILTFKLFFPLFGHLPRGSHKTYRCMDWIVDVA